MSKIYVLICDEHRRDGKEDDPFLPIKDDYVRWRATCKYVVVHNGDTYDCIMGKPGEIYHAHRDLRRYEVNDIFIEGNHEVFRANLELLAPGTVKDNLTIYGYRVLHGHELFSFMDDPWERVLVAHLGWFYRRYQGRAWADALYKWAKMDHRDNKRFFEKLFDLRIFEAVFAHSHSQGQAGGWWNPGDLPTTRTAVILDNTGPRFERIF